MDVPVFWGQLPHFRDWTDFDQPCGKIEPVHVGLNKNYWEIWFQFRRRDQLQDVVAVLFLCPHDQFVSSHPEINLEGHVS